MTIKPGKKREKFVELAEKRVTRAIKDLRLIGNLANKASYEFTDRDVKKIFSALNGELKALKMRFESGGQSDKTLFRL